MRVTSAIIVPEVAASEKMFCSSDCIKLASETAVKWKLPDSSRVSFVIILKKKTACEVFPWARQFCFDVIPSFCKYSRESSGLFADIVIHWWWFSYRREQLTQSAKLHYGLYRQNDSSNYLHIHYDRNEHNDSILGDWTRNISLSPKNASRQKSSSVDLDLWKSSSVDLTLINPSWPNLVYSNVG